jgi:hypothetical protein
MRYLEEKGSSVELLAFSPTLSMAALDTQDDRIVPQEDFNGHKWPNYYYVRGQVTVMRSGPKTTKVTAVPVKKTEIMDHVNEATIIFGPPKK